MKQKDPSHMATHNGLCTSACTISNKLVIRSSLAYGRSFNYLEESLTCVNWSKSRTPKFHQHGVSSCFLSNIIQTAMSLHKWSFNHLSCDILAIVFMDVISPTRLVKVHPSFMDYGNYLNNHCSHNTGTK